VYFGHYVLIVVISEGEKEENINLKCGKIKQFSGEQGRGISLSG
jgi:hypothetical protein